MEKYECVKIHKIKHYLPRKKTHLLYHMEDTLLLGLYWIIQDGGYFIYSHIQSDQADGMTAVIRELLNELADPNDLNPSNNSCIPAECEPCMVASS